MSEEANLYDFVLPCGPRLGDATPQQVKAASRFYGREASTAAANAQFLARMAPLTAHEGPHAPADRRPQEGERSTAGAVREGVMTPDLTSPLDGTAQSQRGGMAATKRGRAYFEIIPLRRLWREHRPRDAEQERGRDNPAPPRGISNHVWRRHRDVHRRG